MPISPGDAQPLIKSIQLQHGRYARATDFRANTVTISGEKMPSTDRNEDYVKAIAEELLKYPHFNRIDFTNISPNKILTMMQVIKYVPFIREVCLSISSTDSSTKTLISEGLPSVPQIHKLSLIGRGKKPFEIIFENLRLAPNITQLYCEIPNKCLEQFENYPVEGQKILPAHLQRFEIRCAKDDEEAVKKIFLAEMAGRVTRPNLHDSTELIINGQSYLANLSAQAHATSEALQHEDERIAQRNAQMSRLAQIKSQMARLAQTQEQHQLWLQEQMKDLATPEQEEDFRLFLEEDGGTPPPTPRPAAEEADSMEDEPFLELSNAPEGINDSVEDARSDDQRMEDWFAERGYKHEPRTTEFLQNYKKRYGEDYNFFRNKRVNPNQPPTTPDDVPPPKKHK